MTNHDAYFLREKTGTSDVEKTARAAAEELAHFYVAHLIVGGLAVQEHGYPRVTLDVDVVVPDVLGALELLTASSSGPFQRLPPYEDRIVDQRTGVRVDLLPAGRVLRHGCKVPFPCPIEICDLPQFASLEQLISLKLDSWSNTPLRRLRDKTDVIELITRRELPRDLAVASAIEALYHELWDGLKAEK